MGLNIADFIHTVFTKITKAGDIYLLDYYPGGNKEKNQTSTHGNIYMVIITGKFTKKNKGKKILGRIGHEGFEKYDRINDAPVYIDGILVKGG